jgi:hypothetical protein
MDAGGDAGVAPDSGTAVNDGGQDGGEGDAGQDGGATRYQGYVELQSFSSADGGFMGWSSGEVELFPQQPGGIQCPQGTLQSGCCVSLYSSPPPPLTLEYAGTLVSSNPRTGEAQILTWDSSNSTYDMVSGFLTWAPGDRLLLSATGGTVETFAAQAVAPQPIAGLPEDPGPLAVSLSGDLTMTWTPAAATYMVVTLDGAAGTVGCRVSDALGTATIPRELVASVAGDAGTGLAVWTRGGAGLADAGNAQVELRITLSEGTDVVFTP